MHRFCKGSAEFQHVRNQRRASRPGQGTLFDTCHDCRANHGAVGDARNGTCLLRRLDAKADDARKTRRAANAQYRRAHVRLGIALRAGDAGDRGIIQISRRAIQHDLEPRVIGRRRKKSNHVDAVTCCWQSQNIVFLGRQIDDEEPIDSRFGGVTCEARRAVRVDRIVGSHQNYGRFVVAFAKAAREIKNLGKRHAAFQRAEIGRLVYRSVGHWIRERNAKFDDVRTGSRQLLNELERRLQIRITRSKERNERRAPALAKVGKRGSDATHIASPSAAAAETTSLSPRPDRHTTMILSFSICAAMRMTWAMACADSSAGMMPSSLDSSTNASSASLSVAEKYFTRPISFSQACSGPTPG